MLWNVMNVEDKRINKQRVGFAVPEKMKKAAERPTPWSRGSTTSFIPSQRPTLRESRPRRSLSKSINTRRSWRQHGRHDRDQDWKCQAYVETQTVTAAGVIRPQAMREASVSLRRGRRKFRAEGRPEVEESGQVHQSNNGERGEMPAKILQRSGSHAWPVPSPGTMTPTARSLVPTKNMPPSRTSEVRPAGHKG